MLKESMKVMHLAKLNCFILILLSGLSFFSSAQVDLKIEGIRSGKLKDNVDLYIKSINPREADDSLRYQELVRTSIDKALRAYGYYQSAVDFELKSNQKSNHPLLIAKVTIGEPVKIAGAEVEILGEAKRDEEFIQLSKRLPKVGEVLNHENYDDYKNELQKLAVYRGYFDADFDISQLEVMPSTHQAWWNLVFNSGKRYYFGKVSFENSQIREDYLHNMVSIQPNEPYHINSISALTDKYTESNWFSSVLLQPQIDEKDKRVDIKVLLRPKKKNSMNVGIGWASDVGPRLQVNWNKPWINDRGHSFRSGLYVSEPRQSLEATYKMPLLKNPLNYYYEFSLGLENEKQNDTQTLGASFAALRYWNHPTGWQYSFGMRARYDSFTQANVQNKTLLFYPSLSVHRTRLKGGLFPIWGDSQRLSLDIGRKFFLSDVSFIKLQLSSAWIRTVAKNHRFISRVEAGWLHTSNLDKIPPNLRFFAGGDRSVRGYGYKKIAPKNADGKLVGGAYLLTGSLEYQYQVYSNWWLASFVDSGYASNKANIKELRYGTGLGVRWASPIGVVKFDIATPIRDKDKSKNIQFYLGLGAEL